LPTSLNKPHQAVPAPPTKSKPLNLKPSSQPKYYHEVDSEFLDFDLWSPGLPEGMLTPISPPSDDRSTTVTATSPQASSFYRWKPSHNTQTTTSKTTSILKRRDDNIQSVKRRESIPPKASDSDLCSFFTAGSLR